MSLPSGVFGPVTLPSDRGVPLRAPLRLRRNACTSPCCSALVSGEAPSQRVSSRLFNQKSRSASLEGYPAFAPLEKLNSCRGEPCQVRSGQVTLPRAFVCRACGRLSPSLHASSLSLVTLPSALRPPREASTTTKAFPRLLHTPPPCDPFPARRHAPRGEEACPQAFRERFIAEQIETANGLVSADRSNKATLPLTTPRRTIKSSANDLAPRIVKLPYAGEDPPLFREGPRCRPSTIHGQRPIRIRLRCRGVQESSLSSMDSDLEAFSHNPADGSFAALPCRTAAKTNYLNQRFLSY